MTTEMISVAEITTKAIELLCRQIRPIDTARFLNQFTTGLGNSTEECDALVGSSTVDGRMPTRSASTASPFDSELPRR